MCPSWWGGTGVLFVCGDGSGRAVCVSFCRLLVGCVVLVLLCVLVLRLFGMCAVVVLSFRSALV